MTNVANQNDDDIIELTDVVIVGTANKAARHTAQVAPDSMLTTQDDSMSTDDILDSMLEEFPKKINPAHDSLENGLNVHGLDGLLKSMDLDNVNDAETITPSLGDMFEEDQVQNLQNTQTPQVAPQLQAQGADIDSISSPLSHTIEGDATQNSPKKMETLDESVFNEDLLSADNTQESFDLMQAMGEDTTLDLNYELENLDSTDFSQQEFEQNSQQQNNFDENFQDFAANSQDLNAFENNFEDVLNQNLDSSSQNLSTDTADFDTTSVDNFGLDGDISDIVDPNSSFNANETDFENFATDAMSITNNNQQEEAFDQTLSDVNMQDNNFAPSSEEFAEVPNVVKDDFPQVSNTISEEFPEAPILPSDDFSEFDKMLSQDLDFDQATHFVDDMSNNNFIQETQSQEDFKQDTQLSAINSDDFEVPAKQGIHVKNDFSDLENIDPETLTVEDINLEEVLSVPEELPAHYEEEPSSNISQGADQKEFLDEMDLMETTNIDNMQDHDAHFEDDFMTGLESLTNNELNELAKDFSMNSDFTDSLDSEFSEQEQQINDIDRSAFENDVELAQMLEMPNQFIQNSEIDVQENSAVNANFDNSLTLDLGRIDNLEDKLDAFSTNTTGRLEILQNSVDTLSTQVSSIEEHINVAPRNVSASSILAEDSSLGLNNESMLMHKLESKVKILESRIEKLEEFFEAQVMLHNSIDPDSNLDVAKNVFTKKQDSTLEKVNTSNESELNSMREEMALMMARLEDLEVNMEKNVALTAARVLKEEIIPLLTEG